MKVKSVIASVGIVGGVLLAGLALWKAPQLLHAQNAGGPPPEPTEFVRFATASEAPFQRTMTAVGTIQALRHLTIAAEVVGKVSEVGFVSGQTVEPGQLLLRLDSATERADLRAAKAQADLARASLDRLTQATVGTVSKQEIDRAQSEFDQTAARVQQLEAMIAKKEVVAPFRGRMGLRDIHPGQYLAEGQRITTLQGVDDEVYVDFSVPQLRAGALPVGASVAVRVGEQELPAKVTAVDAQIEQATRNVRIRATLPSLGGRLVPGMFVDVRIPLGPPAQVVTVPQTAVRRAPFGDYVFVITPDPKDPKQLRAHQRFVDVAGSISGSVIVTKGVTVGDRIAADGSFKLREGVLVMEPPPAAPANGAPAGAPGATPGAPADQKQGSEAKSAASVP
jgi:membrane fusion protein (multidrug efflux system)